MGMYEVRCEDQEDVVFNEKKKMTDSAVDFLGKLELNKSACEKKP